MKGSLWSLTAQHQALKSKARLRPRTDLIWGFLRFPAESRLWRCKRGHLSRDQVRRQAFQPLQTKSKVQSPDEVSLWFPLGWRCGNQRPLRRRTSEPFQQGLSRFWAHHQAEENTDHGSSTWTRLPILQSWSMNWKLSMSSYTLPRRSLILFLWIPS